MALFELIRPPQRITLFPYTTLFRSIVLLCYGGGFGTMPAFAADYFGPTNVGSIYGLMLTAWGFAGVLGPMLIAGIRDRKSTRLNSSHMSLSYAVFCLKKKALFFFLV